jgi:Uma2 family endonuclease
MAAGERLITADEFMRMADPPDGSLQELVRGVVVSSPPPMARHGICCSKVARLIGDYASRHDTGWATCNNAGFILERDPDTVRGPDVAFWSRGRVGKLPDGYFEVPPDLAVEVLSPSDTASKLQAKLLHYLKVGVRMTWVIDPEVGSVAVYRLGEQPRTLDDTETLDGGDVLPGFSCRVAGLFA